MPSLRRSSDREPGYTRARRGKRWRYRDVDGRALTSERTLARMESLVIPPAWREVWICRSARGHLQATGIDEAGRKQYLYHPRWREDRDREKHLRILRFADRLPDLRRVAAGHMRRRRLGRDKALAAAVELLDRTHIRVGGEAYAARGVYGLATLRSKHLAIDGDTLRLDFRGKSGKRQQVEVTDTRLTRVVAEMDRMPGYEIFKYLDEDGAVVDVRSSEVNAYIKEHMGEDFSAKDFRTWAGTVAAAVALDEVGPAEGDRARRRAVAQVVRTAAQLLGNTPAVCRASYIDPRVIDSYLDGVTISALRTEIEAQLEDGHSPEELAVLALLRRGLEERAKAVA